MIICFAEPTKNLENVTIIRIIYFQVYPHQKHKNNKTVTIIQGNDYLHN